MESIKEIRNKLKFWQNKENQYYKYVKWVFYIGIIYTLFFSFLTVLLSPVIVADDFLSYGIIFLFYSIVGFLVIIVILYLLNKVVALRKYLYMVTIILLVIQAIVFSYLTFNFILFSAYA